VVKTTRQLADKISGLLLSQFRTITGATAIVFVLCLKVVN